MQFRIFFHLHTLVINISRSVKLNMVVNSNILHVDLNTQIAPTLPLLPSKNIKRNIAVQRNKFNKLDPVIKIISEGGARVSTISSERQRRYRK